MLYVVGTGAVERLPQVGMFGRTFLPFRVPKKRPFFVDVNFPETQEKSTVQNGLPQSDVPSFLRGIADFLVAWGSREGGFTDGLTETANGGLKVNQLFSFYGH